MKRIVLFLHKPAAGREFHVEAFGDVLTKYIKDKNTLARSGTALLRCGCLLGTKIYPRFFCQGDSSGSVEQLIGGVRFHQYVLFYGHRRSPAKVFFIGREDKATTVTKSISSPLLWATWVQKLLVADGSGSDVL